MKSRQDIFFDGVKSEYYETIKNHLDDCNPDWNGDTYCVIEFQNCFSKEFLELERDTNDSIKDVMCDFLDNSIDGYEVDDFTITDTVKITVRFRHNKEYWYDQLQMDHAEMGAL